MGYTAIDEMRKSNMIRYDDPDIGPFSPRQVDIDEEKGVPFDLALRHFFNERCTDLRFDEDMASREKAEGTYLGRSSRKNQIPHNMQMDIDRLTFERAVMRFYESGSTADAFDVYFCYLEMFGAGYSSSRRMIELLSEYESTASTMLMKHRDHYSHSVYVFLLGIAIFDANKTVREAYKKYYGIDDDKNAAHHFLQFWGMSSLFHDIGYPFEISFAQIESYFKQRKEEKNGMNEKGIPFVCYGNMDSYVEIDDDIRVKLKEWYGGEFDTIEEWLAYDIASMIERTGCDGIKEKDTDKILEILRAKARPAASKKFMDHAYFSTVILFKELFSALGVDNLKREHMDALSAIALHNSLYKRELTDDKDLLSEDHAFELEWHPLAYLLQFVDELQCWDRTSYGRNSRRELHPMGCDFTFGDDGVHAEYIYDAAESKKIIDFWNKYEENREAILAELAEGRDELYDKKIRVKAYSDMTHHNPFAQEIGRIVSLKNWGKGRGSLSFYVSQRVEPANQGRKQIYLSESNFIHMYDFAVALNAQYNDNYSDSVTMMGDFDELSLEYKLSNILQAKRFAAELEAIGCFYTDRPVAYDMLRKFSREELIILGRLEHTGWENEKKLMLWLPAGGRDEELMKNKNELREQARMHYDLGVRFDDLSDEEKAKDMSPLNTMLEKLMEFDGVRVYRYR